MIWSFYRLSDGLLIDQVFSGPLSCLRSNTPDGCGSIAGAHDPMAVMVDLATGALVQREEPPTGDESRQAIWNEAALRWEWKPTRLALASELRATRDARLAECDWVVTRALERGEPVPAAWLAYREALRNLPLQEGFPAQVDWPELPA